MAHPYRVGHCATSAAIASAFEVLVNQSQGLGFSLYACSDMGPHVRRDMGPYMGPHVRYGPTYEIWADM